MIDLKPLFLNKRFLTTGASGFIDTHLIKGLQMYKSHVSVL